MDGMLWHLIWINLITPSFPFIFPLRLAITAGAAATMPWWLVLFIANTAGGLGMFPVYAIARWKAADRWHQRLEEYPSIRRMRKRWRNNMFVVQVLMNATPLPDAASAALAGCERYPFWRLLLAQIIGRSFHNLPLVLGGTLLAQFGWFHRLLAIVSHPLIVVIGTIVVFAWWWHDVRQRSVSTDNET